MKAISNLSGLTRFIKFGMVGVLNTLINWGIFYFLNYIGVYYIVSNVIGYTVATINSYLWNSKWVFNYTNERFKTLIKFVLLNLFGMTINTGILFILVEGFKIKKMVAVIIATFIVMIINYFINKLWIFRKKEVELI